MDEERIPMQSQATKKIINGVLHNGLSSPSHASHNHQTVIMHRFVLDLPLNNVQVFQRLELLLVTLPWDRLALDGERPLLQWRRVDAKGSINIFSGVGRHTRVLQKAGDGSIANWHACAPQTLMQAVLLIGPCSASIVR